VTLQETIALTQQAYELRLQGKLDLARRALEPLLDLTPPPAVALILMAECLQQSDDGETEEIGLLLRQGARLSPNCPDAQLELAHFIFAWLDENDEARSLLSDARKLISQANLSADLLEAALLRDEGRVEDAVQLLSRTAATYPNSGLVREELKSLRALLDASG